jgi:hypothetical protein
MAALLYPAAAQRDSRAAVSGAAAHPTPAGSVIMGTRKPRRAGDAGQARSDTGLQYRSSFDVREDPEDPTRVDVPLAQ